MDVPSIGFFICFDAEQKRTVNLSPEFDFGFLV